MSGGAEPRRPGTGLPGPFAELPRYGRRPPLWRWDPPCRGELDIRIAGDGSWYHEGGAIRRPALVRLLAGVLRREADGGHYLVTPHEKFRIRVDDAPFIAIDMEAQGQGSAARLWFRTNVDEVVIAGPGHAIEVRAGAGNAPRVYVRDGLEAVLARPVYYRLAERVEVRPDGAMGVWSGGVFHVLAGGGGDRQDTAGR